MRGVALRLAAALLLASIPSSPRAALSPEATLEDCDALVRAHPDEKDSYRCYYEVARRRAVWDDAERRLQTHRASSDYALVMLAVLTSARGRADEAQGLYREAIAAFAARGNRAEEGLARLGLARTLRRAGRAAEAAVELDGAEALGQATGDRALVSWVRLERASQLEAEGRDYGAAYRLLRQVETDAFPDGPYQLRINCLGALARLTQFLGRNQESLASLRRVEETARAAGDKANVAVALTNRLYMELDLVGEEEDLTPESLVPLARSAVEAAIAAGSPAAEAGARWALGQLLPAPEGRAEYERSLSISRRDDDVEGIGAALRGLAEYIAVEEPDRLAEAHRALDEALAIARRSGNLEEMVRASLSRATIEWRRGPRDRAVADGLATLDGIDALRDLQPEEAARSGIVSRWLPAYRGLAGFLLASDSGVPGPDGLALAFAVQERMRARVLREALDAALRAEDGAQPRPPSPADERIAATRAQIAGVQRLLIDPALSGAARQAALSRLEQLEIDEAALRRDASGGLATGAAAPGPTRAAAIEEVRRALPADTALLAYQVAPRAHLRDLPGGAWLVVVTAGRARAYPLPEPSSLASTIGMFTGLIERRDGREGPAAARLYRDLLEPALGDLPSTVTHLVFVLDGILHAVPFAVLRPAPDADPLAARYDLTAAPSATLWLRFREAAARPATIPAIAYADPDLGAPVNGRNEAVATVGASRAWAFGLGARLGAMPRARAEGRSLVDRLGGGSRLLAGKEASERSVKSGDLGRFAIVHFAAHAVLDDEHPERSSLVLAPGDPGEDGLLQPREVVDLELGGRLVVLSSCRSASGAILAGEGVMGLARAFFRAGARTVVGSLWSLRDADAADLFEQFYERIGRGESVAGALAGAQRDLRSRGRPAAAWAGLVVLGDGSAVPVPAGTAHPAGPAWLSWAAAALAGAIIVATALLLVRRARAGG